MHESKKKYVNLENNAVLLGVAIFRLRYANDIESRQILTRAVGMSIDFALKVGPHGIV